MMKTLLLFSSLCIVCIGSAFAQGESALPFLLISPAAVSNGMGETSVALYRDDPLAALSNPAHLGMFGRSNYFSAGYDYADWLPQFQSSDLTIKTFGFNAGINLQREFGIAPELSIGLAYSRIRLNLGEFNETSPDGPEVISTFNAFETADNYSIGIGFHYWISASAGFTYKQVNSNLAPFNVQGQDRKGQVSVPTNDFGFLVTVPVTDIIDKLREAPMMLLQDFSPVLNLSAGMAKNNMGNKMVVYIDPDQPDPLPRYARVGVGVELGVSRTDNGLDWYPLLFSWSRESNDILVRRFPPPVNSQGIPIGDPPPPEYRSGFGDIRFVDDLILGKSNPDVIIKTGWQLSLCGILSIRGGRFLEAPDRGNRRFSTSGYSLSLGGIIRMLRVLEVPVNPDNLFGFMITHLDLRYTHSEIETDETNHPLDETEFSSWTLVVSP